MQPRVCSVNVRRIVGKNSMGCKQVKANGILCREDCSIGNLLTTPEAYGVHVSRATGSTVPRTVSLQRSRGLWVCCWGSAPWTAMQQGKEGAKHQNC